MLATTGSDYRAAAVALPIVADPPPAVALAFCRGPLEALPVEHLAPGERRYLQTLEVPRRRHSYLLGRLAARRALQAVLGAERAAGLTIARGAFTQPVVDHEALDVAISHCDDIGAALAFPRTFPMGVDLENVAPDKVRTMQTVLTATEQQTVAALSDPRRRFLSGALWTAKEALSKALRCGMTCPFQLFAVRDLQHSAEQASGYFENFYQYRFLALPVFEGRVIGVAFPRTAQLSLSAPVIEDLLR